ncbi:hypothetical protein E2C01_037963 [Portunus trituberculatus]|uniref:Uncharacterized protein n=1 Tax=Portunus trituberculatus TaxID=210409 RepID=A0A5B7FAX6_PORTR|nr:hypothetical protein [Portunus trituberculatus]
MNTQTYRLKARILLPIPGRAGERRQGKPGGVQPCGCLRRFSKQPQGSTSQHIHPVYEQHKNTSENFYAAEMGVVVVVLVVLVEVVVVLVVVVRGRVE